VTRAGSTARLALALTLALAAAGCGKPSVASGDAPASGLGTPPAPSVTPADHLGPDELIEGSEKAFGLPLPRGLTVGHRYAYAVDGTGTMTVHALVMYFRPRLQGGTLRESDRVATFEHVTVPGLPPYTDLTIRLATGLNETRVDVVSTTHPPAAELPDVPSRWRQVGLTPDGKVLDPTHLD
jgi:hypothetical protein